MFQTKMFFLGARSSSSSFACPESRYHRSGDFCPDVVSLNSTLGALVNSSAWREAIQLWLTAPAKLPVMLGRLFCRVFILYQNWERNMW